MNKIALLNDALRSTFAGGNVVMTAGVDALPDMVKAEALKKAATFGDFSEENDPYGERDFGSFELCGRKFFWKVRPSCSPRSTERFVSYAGRQTPRVTGEFLYRVDVVSPP